MKFAFTKCHGSGNDFPLIDGRNLTLTDGEWASVARALADRSGPVGGDGLLVFHGAISMQMRNSDGTEAETCLNGLRCVARAGFEALGLDEARVTLKSSTADVARAPDLAPGVVTIRTTAQASLSPADVGLRTDAPADRFVDATIPGLPSPRTFTAVAMPNPHLVTFVDAVDEAELIALGAWCEAGPALIPGRANVSFVEMRGGDLFVRTFERGVGLTNSCGSAMAASVYSAALTGRIGWDQEVRVFNKGGLVRSAASEAGAVTILGNATFLYDAEIEVDMETETASGLRIVTTRDDEAAAWDGVLAQIG